jgi:hypothetical protein
MKKIVLIAVLISALYYIYNDFFLVSENKVTINELIDNVTLTPVSAQQAKIAFKDVMFGLCKVNGVDTDNGFGTTDECLNNFETLASEYCFDQLSDFESKVYTSKLDLIADLKAFNLCSMDIVMGK